MAALIAWAQTPWFDMAEGDYPFHSDYITYAVGPGEYPLPPWPVRVACARVGDDAIGEVNVSGDVEDVRFVVSLGGGRLTPTC